MNKNKLLIGTAALAIFGMAIFPSFSYAYRKDSDVKGIDCDPGRHEAMIKAFDENDYDAWIGLMQGKGRVTKVINKENFAMFAKAHELFLQGKTDEAAQIRNELGLGLKEGLGKGDWNGHGMKRMGSGR